MKNIFLIAFWVMSFFVITSHTTIAQNNPTENVVKELFKNPKKIQWFKHYKGRVDDINDVGLVIAYDGKTCKGFITYLRSKERFKLEGEIRGNNIKLRETDIEESITGYFEGQFFSDFQNLKAHWFNREKTRAGLLMLELVDKEVEFPTYCGDNKWVRKYNGLILGKPVVLTLQRNSEHNIEGIIWYENKKVSQSLKGAMIDEDKFKVVVLDDLCNKVGGIEGTILNPNHSFTGNWITPEGDTHQISFKKMESLMVGCIEYQDYMSTYDVIFPKSKNSSFNDFIDHKVAEWKNSCKQYVKELKEKNQYPGPEDRAISSAAGWFKIEHLSDTLISGNLTFNKSWEDQYEDISFNYNLLNDENFELKDLFRDGVDYHTLLREIALKTIQFKPIYADEGFRNWIKAAEFNHFTIRDNGIRYSSTFHPIYGRQSVTIPFIDIQDHLNPYNPVNYLYLDVVPVKRKKKKKIQR